VLTGLGLINIADIFHQKSSGKFRSIQNSKLKQSVHAEAVCVRGIHYNFPGLYVANGIFFFTCGLYQVNQ
jgi:hypothetical protein